MHAHQDSKFEIWEEGSLTIRTKINNKTLDLGFSILNDTEKDLYDRVVILETELVFCVSKENHLANRTEISIEDIRNEPIILMREGFFQTRLLTEMFHEVGAKPNIVLVSSQITLLSNFVKMNLGSAVLIKELVDPNDESIIGLSFKDKLTIKIGLLWRKDMKLHASAKEFVEYVTKEEL